MDFKVKCVRYIRDGGEYFTVGKIYDVADGVLTCDDGYRYTSWSLPYNGNGDFEALRNWFSRHWDFELVEEKKVFTKNDLQNGDVVLRKNGVVEVFVSNPGVFVGKDGFMPLHKVKGDLTHSGSNHGWDIVAVRRPKQDHECQFTAFDAELGELVYDRERDTKKLYNGKVVCIDLCGYNQGHYTVGKIYQFVDGKITTDCGSTTPYQSEIHSFEEWELYTYSKFIEIKE